MGDDRNEVALCLSGGGFRAALFHLGSLRRLNELGILSQVDTLSTVSGGSMLAGHLANHIQAGSERGVPWPRPGGVWPGFNAMADELHSKLSEHFRLAGTLSCNEAIVSKLPGAFKQWIGPMKLLELPERPDFVFNATELDSGRLWSFSRTRVGSDEFGYSARHGHALVAEAVAASACFPVFNQLVARFNASDFAGGTREVSESEWKILLADGGIFDNLGVERVAQAQTILVSDGGKGARPLPSATGVAPFASSVTMGKPARNQFEALRWILSDKSRDPTTANLRLERLSHAFSSQEVAGSYWSIGDGRDDEGSEAGYSRALAQEMIATVRTQLDAFSQPERHVLENHGYLVTDAALKRQAPDLTRVQCLPVAPWGDALSAEFVKNHLRDSRNISSGLRAIYGLFRRRGASPAK